ncbi:MULTISPECIES: hypothetical protein [unclassified Rhizobium]|nr:MULTISPECIES: hypothetical protein [unclassified Rhizobium]
MGIRIAAMNRALMASYRGNDEKPGISREGGTCSTNLRGLGP